MHTSHSIHVLTKKCVYNVTLKVCAFQSRRNRHSTWLTASMTSLTRPWLPPQTVSGPPATDELPSWGCPPKLEHSGLNDWWTRGTCIGLVRNAVSTSVNLGRRKKTYKCLQISFEISRHAMCSTLVSMVPKPSVILASPPPWLHPGHWSPTLPGTLPHPISNTANK